MSAKRSKQGFGLVGILLVLLLLAVGGLGGWYVFTKNNKQAAQANNSGQQTNNSSNQMPIPDPYEGWKNHCSATHYCFRYPADWTLNDNGQQATLLNADKTVEVDYINPYTKDGAVISFSPVHLGDLADKSLGLKVVGGTNSTTHAPSYRVVDSVLLESYPLTVGQAAQFPNTPRFKDTHATGTYYAVFSAMSTVGMTDEAAASAWFTTDAAKTSLKVLESLYYQ